MNETERAGGRVLTFDLAVATKLGEPDFQAHRTDTTEPSFWAQPAPERKTLFRKPTPSRRWVQNSRPLRGLRHINGHQRNVLILCMMGPL